MFELLFKYPRAVFERGELILLTSFDVVTAAFITAAVAAVILWSLRRYRRHLRGGNLFVLGALQLALAAVALAMLFQPVVEVTQLRDQDNAVLVLLDTSASMLLSDDGVNSRMQQALPIVEEQIVTPLSEDFDVQLFTFSETWDNLEDLLSPPPPGNRTRLTTALTDLLSLSQNTPVGGVILVSDGADNSGEIPPRWYAELARFGIPVHTVGIGAEAISDDIELVSVDLPQRAAPDADLAASVVVRSSTAGEAQLKVYDRSEILASEDIVLAGRGNLSRHTVSIPTGAVGVRHLSFVVESTLVERNRVNNTRRQPLTVAAREPRVLYLEGEPRWEFKFIRRAADAQRLIHLHSLLQTSTNNFYRQGIESEEQLVGGYPTLRSELFTYDALIIGSQDAAGLSTEQHELIKEFVSERGGSLLMLGGLSGLADGGWQNTVVADVLPVRLSNEQGPSFIREMADFQITTAGLRTPWLQIENDSADGANLWGTLPDIADYQLVGTPKPGSVTLLEAILPNGTTPLLTMQRYGKGKSFVLATGGTWRWQMQMPSEDQTHETFWQRLLQELVRESPRQIDFFTDRAWYMDEGSMALRARVFDSDFEARAGASVEAQITHANGSVQDVSLTPSMEQPGLYTATATIDSPGVAQLDMTATDEDVEIGSVRLFVERDNGVIEYFDAAQNRALLERIAAQTGGRYYTLQSVDQIPAQIRFSSSGISERQWLPLWNMPINFLLLFGIKAIEWLLRRQWGHL